MQPQRRRHLAILMPLVRVAKWVECLEGSSRPVVHDVDVLGPASLMVEEEAEASNGVRRLNHIAGVDCWMREVEVRPGGGGGEAPLAFLKNKSSVLSGSISSPARACYSRQTL